mmetsp:Transcript_1809/g.2517  ORF Transcript_1809/g.2517 Transcript_1809/m.2517 type:complete len:94 (+) Transcript_1809:2-283(+)
MYQLPNLEHINTNGESLNLRFRPHLETPTTSYVVRRELTTTTSTVISVTGNSTTATSSTTNSASTFISGPDALFIDHLLELQGKESGESTNAK